MKYICAVLIALFILTLFSGCREFTPPQADEPLSFTSYLDIPDITEDEIEAIEALRDKYDYFIYGMPLSTEAFIKEDGSIGGYSVLFAEWLTQLFDIPFQTVNCEWNNTIDAFKTGKIHFNGSMVATEHRRDTFFQTGAIAQRSIVYFRLAGQLPIAEIIKERPAKIGLLKDTASAEIAVSLLSSESFIPVYISDTADVYDRLKSGEIDAFAHSNTMEVVFEGRYDIVTEIFYPIIFTPVSLTAYNPEFQPIISVVDKALKQGGTLQYLAHLYNMGYNDYRRHKFQTQLTDEEKDYLINNHVVNTVMQPDNYPLSFYNKYTRQWEGIASDILFEVEDLTGLSFQVINTETTSVTELLEKLESGEAALVSGLIRTPDREGRFIWPEHVNMSSNYALISKAEFRDIRVNEIFSVRVGLLRDSAHTEVFRSWFPYHDNNIEYDTLNDLVDALDSGKIDMVMQSESWLLYLTNFMERPDFKANIVFDSPYTISFGLNKDETVLCSIVDKSLNYINTTEITRHWMNKTYDFRATISEARQPLLIGMSIALGSAIVLLFIVFIITRNSNSRAKLILDATPLACRLWDKNLKVIDCNEEAVRLFKMKDKQDYIDHYYDLLPEKQPDGQITREVVNSALKKAFDEGKYELELMHQMRDGTPLPTESKLVRVLYGGKYVVAGYARDLREHKRMINEIEYRDNLLLAGKRSAMSLLTILDDENFEDSLLEGMEYIGRYLNLDRIYIWQITRIDGEQYFHGMYKWLNETRRQTYPVPPGGNLRISDFSNELVASLSDNECVGGPTSGFNESDRDLLEIFGIESIMFVPIFVREDFWGLVTFEDFYNERIFTGDELDILRWVSLMMVDTIIRNEMTQSIRDANSAKSDFLANMSHEMRTPLNAILGLSELALSEGDMSKNAKENIDKVFNAGETLLYLVNDILDLSKIEAGKFEILPNEYDVPSLINDTINNNILRIGEKPITFSLDINETLPAKLYGDDLRIRQILSNLLTNAFKYTEEGTVTLGIQSVREKDDVWLTAYVKDTGIGIKPEDIGDLFKDYVQMNTKTNRKIEGTGLGLPITKMIVEMMGGSLSVESEYGKGSTFTIRVKQGYVDDTVIGIEVENSLKYYSYADEKRKQYAKLKRINLPNTRVLIVDDVQTNLDVARGLMKPYGMKVDTVLSGRQAVNAIKNENVIYDAVFMDHMMPGMDGIEATERIRKIGTDYAKNIPIIALTANAIVGNEQMFLDKGFQAFLTKPIELARLDLIIHQWLLDKNSEKQSSQTESVKSGESSPPPAYLDAEGLDVKKALEAFDDEDTYIDVLRSYLVNTPELIENIQSVKEGDLTDYTIIVHGIKGSSRGIFANEIADMAEKLEKSAKEKDYDFINANNDVFIEDVKKLLSVIEGILLKYKDENPKEKKDEPDKDLLIKILNACKAYDIDILDAAVKELESYEYESGGDLVEWLKDNISQLNFSDIISKLSFLED